MGKTQQILLSHQEQVFRKKKNLKNANFRKLVHHSFILFLLVQVKVNSCPPFLHSLRDADCLPYPCFQL